MKKKTRRKKRKIGRFSAFVCKPIMFTHSTYVCTFNLLRRPRTFFPTWHFDSEIGPAIIHTKRKVPGRETRFIGSIFILKNRADRIIDPVEHRRGLFPAGFRARDCLDSKSEFPQPLRSRIYQDSILSIKQASFSWHFICNAALGEAFCPATYLLVSSSRPYFSIFRDAVRWSLWMQKIRGNKGNVFFVLSSVFFFG